MFLLNDTLTRPTLCSAMSAAGHGELSTPKRDKVRRSYPYQANTIIFGAGDSEVRCDGERFFDMGDILFVALGSRENGRRTLNRARNGKNGADFLKLLNLYGIVESGEISKIKWATGSNPGSGRPRVVATANACVAVLRLIETERQSTKHHPCPPPIRLWLEELADKQRAPQLEEN